MSIMNTNEETAALIATLKLAYERPVASLISVLHERIASMKDESAALSHKILSGVGVVKAGHVVITEPAEIAGLVVPLLKPIAEGTAVSAAFRVNAGTSKAYALSIKPLVVPAEAPKVEAPAPAPSVETTTPMTAPAGPKKDTNGFFIDQQTRKVLNAIHNISKKLGFANVILAGPSGYGKTSLAAKFAEISGRGFVRINCAVVRDPEEWFGYREAKDGSTVFDPTEFTKAITKGDMVVLLDEVNRLEPWLLNSLFPLLDDDRATSIHGHEVRVAKNTIFMMTLNLGVQYTGTFQLDEAFLNRTDAVVNLGPMPESEEVKVLMSSMGLDEPMARKIAMTMGSLRSQNLPVDCSTRASKNIAKLVVGGLTVREAFEHVVMSRLTDKNDVKKAADVVNSKAGTL